MRRTTTACVALALAIALSPGCETYDPPPEALLVIPNGGKWYLGDPLKVGLSEAVDLATLSISIWPRNLDIEGEILPGTEPVVRDCTLATQPCQGVGMTLSDDGLQLVVDLGATFADRLGRPYILDVAPGLSDVAGRVRDPRQRFEFQVSPTPTQGEVDLELESGVISLVSDLGDVLGGVMLRMFIDMGTDPLTGETWMMATVAEMQGDYPPNYERPEPLVPRLDDKGWTVLMEGQVTPLGGGEYYLDTVPTDLHVKVLGVIDVQLEGFRLEATITPRGADDGRDLLEGFLSSEKALLGNPSSPDDLGKVGVSWIGFGYRHAEVPMGLPRLCEPEPCAVLLDGGGDCQLPLPWTPGPNCP